MENSIIVLAGIAIVFGIFNIVLWLFVIKGDKKNDVNMPISTVNNNKKEDKYKN